MSDITRCASFPENQHKTWGGLRNRQLRFWERGKSKKKCPVYHNFEEIAVQKSLGWGHMTTKSRGETQQSEMLFSVLLARRSSPGGQDGGGKGVEVQPGDRRRSLQQVKPWTDPRITRLDTHSLQQPPECSTWGSSLNVQQRLSPYSWEGVRTGPDYWCAPPGVLVQ